MLSILTNQGGFGIVGGPNFGRRRGVKIAGNIYKQYEGESISSISLHYRLSMWHGTQNMSYYANISERIEQIMYLKEQRMQYQDLRARITIHGNK